MPTDAQPQTAPLWKPGPPAEMSRVSRLIGTWDVSLRTAKGRVFQAPGPWTVESILGGTTLRMRGVYPQVGVTLEMLFSFDRFTGEYRLAVADDQAGQLDIYEGSFTGSSLVMTNLKSNTFITDPATGAVQHVRLELRGLDGDRPSIVAEGSLDRGKTWINSATLEFSPRK